MYIYDTPVQKGPSLTPLQPRYINLEHDVCHCTQIQYDIYHTQSLTHTLPFYHPLSINTSTHDPNHSSMNSSHNQGVSGTNSSPVASNPADKLTRSRQRPPAAPQAFPHPQTQVRCPHPPAPSTPDKKQSRRLRSLRRTLGGRHARRGHEPQLCGHSQLHEHGRRE